MKHAHWLMVCAGSYLRAHAGTLILAVVLLCMVSTPRPAWGQWTGGPTGPIYYNGGNVGIGTTSPDRRLTVQGTALQSFTGSTLGIGLVKSGAYTHGDLSALDFANTTYSLPLGRVGLMMTNWGSYLQFGTSNSYNFGITNTAMTIDPSGNVGVGTTNPQYLLSVNGTVGAKDVIVTNTGWADYVFRSGYRLRPLSEVNAYIEAHHHLPDIPSEAEVKEKGVSVGEMQAKLLAKVEELTLHMIQQEKDNQELRERIAQLETRAAGSGAPAVGR
jgi:hypothetical protein